MNRLKQYFSLAIMFWSAANLSQSSLAQYWVPIQPPVPSHDIMFPGVRERSIDQNDQNKGSDPAPTGGQPSAPSGQPSLNLTSIQKQKIYSIRQSSATQLMALLTPDQQAKLQQAASNPSSVMAALNLTPEQKTKIQAIQADEGQQIKSVLTAAQIKILQNRTSTPK